MRILVFVEVFMSPTLTFVYNELIGLSNGNEVKVITTKRMSENEFPFPNIEVIPYNVHVFTRKYRWEVEKRDLEINRWYAPFAKRLNKVISEFNPDVIQSHFGYESLILLDNLNLIKTPIFLMFHGYDASSMLSKRCYVNSLNKYISSFNVTPVYVSENMKNDLLVGGVNVSSGRLNYYGINIELFGPVPKPHSNKFIFLQICSFMEKKGHAYTLKAFKKFLDGCSDKSLYRLILAGGLLLLEKMKALTKELGIEANVEFPGYVTPKEARALFLKADVFVHHSIVASNGDMEGIPNAIIEAMAMELPVISTWHSGIPELVEDGINGYLVKEKDIESYALRMRDILSWKKLPRNREKIIKQFSNEVHLQRLLKLLEEKNIYS
jgi:colanic acid/amylovoran biosynthesis glycosyltransferase